MNHYSFEQIEEGLEEQFTITITQEMLDTFCQITGDHNPLHTNEEFAKKKGYASKVCYGMLTASFFSTLAGVYLPGEKSIIHSVETMFKKPVFVGDTLTVIGKVTEKNEVFHVMLLKVTIYNQNKDKVIRGTMKVGFLDDKE